MKTALILNLVSQALAGVVVSSRVPDDTPVHTRTFELPPFPGNPWPTRHPDTNTERSDVPTTEGPDPDKVQIIGVTHGGTGCPAGTVQSVISDDRQIMTLIFDQYVASIGPYIDVKENRKNCQVNLNLRYPGGFQYSIFSADYRGYAYLDEGVTGTQKSTYYFSGQTEQAETSTTWEGPYDADYVLHDETNQTSTVWSPCGANGALNINSQVRLTATDATKRGQLTNDSVDLKFKQIVHIRWQKCEEESIRG